jgi:hypothetical protein
MCGLDERFTGNAPEMEAVAAEFFFLFNENGLGTELGRTGRNGQASCSAADNPDIIFIIGHNELLLSKLTNIVDYTSKVVFDILCRFVGVSRKSLH